MIINEVEKILSDVYAYILLQFPQHWPVQPNISLITPVTKTHQLFSSVSSFNAGAKSYNIHK